MGNEYAVFLHKRGLLIGGPNAMRHHRFDIGLDVIVFAKEGVFVIGIPIKGIVGANGFIGRSGCLLRKDNSKTYLPLP